MNDSDKIKQLLKIAAKQQKIIEKLAQQVAATNPSALVVQLNELLDDVRTVQTSNAKVTKAESTSDGQVFVTMTGSLTSPEMNEFKNKCVQSLKLRDVTMVKITRIF
jgi:uncharacterized coiled-coil protein SlyX